MILPDLAEKILNEVRKLINEDFIVVNTEGIIIASTDQSRIGHYHEGAFIAAQEKRKLIITKGDQLKLQGVKAGINFPIFFQNEVIGILGITGEPSTVSPFGEIVRKMTELLISENYYSSQFEWQSRALEAFVMDWLGTKDWENTPVDRARLLGVDLSLDRLAVIIELRNMDSPLPREIWSSIFDWNFFTKNDVAVRWGNNRLVILLDYSLQPAREEVKRKISSFMDFIQDSTGIVPYAGIGQAVSSKEVSHTYRQAERALKNASQSEPLVFDEDLTLEMLLDGLHPNLKKEFISRTLGPILQEKELIFTLRELFAQNNSLKKTAENLHIHINTLHYRLKKIEETTLLDPKNTHDLATLYLSISILDENTKIN